MIVEIRIDPARARRWHIGLVERLDAVAGLHVGRISHGRASPPPPAVGLLLRLESILQRRFTRASDRILAGALGGTAREAGVAPDLLIDLSDGGDRAPAGVRVLRPCFDGCAGEDAVFAALLQGRMPTVEIVDAASGAVLAAGAVSGECATGIGSGYEAVVARLTTLLVACVQGRRLLAPGSLPQPRLTCRPAAADAIRFWMRGLAYRTAHALYAMCCYTPHWRIGWRWIEGADVWDRQSLDGPAWNTLPDPGFCFYADPVPYAWHGRSFVFFEKLDHRIDKGVISVVEVGPHGPVGEVRTVLEEPWHLSYPFLVEHAGEIWMIPESSSRGDVGIYRANPFPHRWEREGTLVSGLEAGDATVVARDGRFWMFAATREGGGGWSDTLSLFHAPDLLGPWAPHRGNPLLIDRAAARPAGNVVARNGRLWRPVQDCTERYGGGLGLAEITRLDEDGYDQVVHKVLRPGPAWPGRRLHTLNRAGALECIDGSAAPVKLLSRRPRRRPGRPAHSAVAEPAAN